MQNYTFWLEARTNIIHTNNNINITVSKVVWAWEERNGFADGQEWYWTSEINKVIHFVQCTTTEKKDAISPGVLSWILNFVGEDNPK